MPLLLEDISPSKLCVQLSLHMAPSLTPTESVTLPFRLLPDHDWSGANDILGAGLPDLSMSELKWRTRWGCGLLGLILAIASHVFICLLQKILGFYFLGLASSPDLKKSA